jgi:hypothetical protein
MVTLSMKNKKEVQSVGVIKREDFGQGELGDHCFFLIEHGITCEAIVGLDGERCGEPATGTTDFDVLGDPTILGHCNEEHHWAIKIRVEKELALSGRNTVVGRNGFGRSAGVLFSR